MFQRRNRPLLIAMFSIEHKLDNYQSWCKKREWCIKNNTSLYYSDFIKLKSQLFIIKFKNNLWQQYYQNFLNIHMDFK